MPIPPKDGKLLYHLTDFGNIDSILSKGLLPRSLIDFEYNNIADEEILKDREKFDLAKYTPFHFFCPTPFSGAAQKAKSDSEFVYVAIARTVAEKKNFKIVPKTSIEF